MIARGLRRLATIYLGLIGVTIVLSLLIALITGNGIERSVSVGLYIAGAVLLLGCFLVGGRGPLRGVSRTGETVPIVGARGVRPASLLERSEATRTSLLLFLLGLTLILLGALIDPAHKAF